MKKFMKKCKPFLLLVLMLCLLLAGCNSEPQDNSEQQDNSGQNDSGLPAATEYDFTVAEGEENQIVEALYFEKDVTVSGDNGVIIFVDCVFQENIINKGTIGTKVMLEGSQVKGKCIIKNEEKEATIDSSLPKFLSDSSIDVTCEDCYGSIVALGDFPVTLNGETYEIPDAEFFFEEDIVPYEGQEASVLSVAQWWENGEIVLFTMAEAA